MTLTEMSVTPGEKLAKLGVFFAYAGMDFPSLKDHRR
jgi:hypothetical protein